jgi:dihydrofolate reductase
MTPRSLRGVAWGT